MSYHYSPYSQPLVRTNSAPQRYSHQQNKHNNLQKAHFDIRYHQPFERLQRRITFQNIWKEHVKTKEEYLSYDNFAIFDAVAKRGGFSSVCAHNRWQEISYSLCLDKKQWNFTQYYFDIVHPHQSRLMQLLPWYPSSQVYTSQVIQAHLLPSNTLTSAYYQITQSETLFMQANFFSIDEYFNLKTVALLEPDSSKIPVQYAEKYIMIRKRMIFSNQVKDVSPRELKMMNMQPNQDTKVAIIGLSLQSLLIADKLSQLGLSVLIFDKGKKQRQQTHMVQSGLVLLEGGKQKGSYHSNLVNLGIITEEIGTYSALIDEEGKVMSEERTKMIEEHFMGIVNQLKEELMNKKKFYEQLMSRVLRRKLEHQKLYIKWHYDRYLLFNRIKGESTTVSDIVNYQAKKYVKHLTQSYQVVAVRSWHTLYQKVKTRENVIFINRNIQNVVFNSGTWNIRLKEQVVSVKYLVYCDHQIISKGITDGTPRLPEIGSDILGQSASIFHQLITLKYVNCLYTFREKVVLRQSLQHHTSWTINSNFGFIYYFLLPSGHQIIAVIRYYPNSNINYYNQIFSLLDSRCLAKGMKLVGDSNWAYQTSFSLKDEKSLQNLVKIKPNQKLFMVLPITTVNCPHKLPSIIDLTNYVSMNILEDVYSDYSSYDHSYRRNFKQNQAYKQEEKQQVIEQKENREEQKQGRKVMQAQSVGKDLVKTINEASEKVTAVFQQQETRQQVDSIKLGHDCFGIGHPIVKNYQLLIRNHINDDSYKQNVCQLSKIIVEQIPLQNNLCLYSLGQPFVYSPQWSDCILENPNQMQKQWVFPLNKMVTRNMHISISNPSELTIYYQTVLVIQQEIYFCIVDQKKPQNILYHTDMQILINTLNAALSKIAQKNKLSFKRVSMGDHPSKYIASTIIEESIKSQLSSKTKPYDIDRLLQDKLTKMTKSRRSRSIPKLSEAVSSRKKQPYKVLNCFVDVNYNLAIIVKQLEAYSQSLLKVMQLKQFNLSDLFFGVINEQYMCCQIMKCFEAKPLNLDQIDRIDPKLSKQLKNSMEKEISNQNNEIMIQAGTNSVLINRNFLHKSRKGDYQLYTYKYSKQQTQSHLLVTNSLQIQFKSKQEIFIHILKSLVINHHNFDIIRQFQLMLIKDLQKVKSLSPRLQLFFRMVKMDTKKASFQDQLKIYEKCKELSQKQKLKAVQLVKNKKMLWVDNDFVFVSR